MAISYKSGGFVRSFVRSFVRPLARSLSRARELLRERTLSRGERQYAEIVLTRRGRGVETATAPMHGTIRSASAKGRRRKPFCVSAHANRSGASFSLALYAYERALISFTLISLRACARVFRLFRNFPRFLPTLLHERISPSISAFFSRIFLPFFLASKRRSASMGFVFFFESPTYESLM